MDHRGEPIYTARAGLVITAPFLPKLFEQLGYLTDGRFSSEETKSRAVHVLEFVATGLKTVEEHDLVLQKILAGVPVHRPVDPPESLTDHEMETSESMLRGLIANWEAIGQATVGALRETFLIREGTLQESDDPWTLQVQTSGTDILLDWIPWDISLVELPWMEHRLGVEWR